MWMKINSLYILFESQAADKQQLQQGEQGSPVMNGIFYIS